MIWQIVTLAAGMGMPFGQPAPPPAPVNAMQHYELRFEIVEDASDYQLNAIVIDARTGLQEIFPVSRCATVDLDPFTEGLFGSPVLCDTESYVYDIEGMQLVVQGTTRRHLVKRLPPGNAIVNGVPLMIEATSR